MNHGDQGTGEFVRCLKRTRYMQEGSEENDINALAEIAGAVDWTYGKLTSTRGDMSDKDIISALVCWTRSVQAAHQVYKAERTGSGRLRPV